ncbi:ABC transporter permease [Thalassotalea sp. PS06]|uniref:ABC transporter permease n=1 Tax=Thalassotalea sp. PS06 TaxID=2594005 RepID=UPI0021B14892|nr:ABC transporter permease [Thalassotalea sp. PS06]
MCDSIHALMLREVKTRFGSNRLGYFWAIAEPFAQATIMAAMFTAIGRNSLSGVPVAMFLISGILPFKMFSKLMPQLAASVSANKGLLGYRQVEPIDPLITRFIIEMVTFVIVYAITVSVLAWIGFEVMPENFSALVLITCLLSLLALGLGLLLCSATIYWEDTPKIVSILMMPMFLISGIFFSATMIPSQYWFLFDWNPIFHVIELSRDAYFQSYTTPVGDWKYVCFVVLCCLAAGLMTFQINRLKFITA